MLRVHIEPKSRLGDAHVPALDSALRGARAAGRELTVADAAALSGLPLDLAEQALITLAHRYPARIRVTEDGALLFRFASLAARRGPGAWSRLGRALRRAAERPLALLLLLLSPFLLGALTGNLLALGHGTIEAPAGFLLAVPAGLIALFSAIGAILTLLVFIVMPIAGLAMIAGGLGVAVTVLNDSGGAGVGAVLFAVAFGGLCLYLGARITWASFRILYGLVVRDTSWVARVLVRVRDFTFGPPTPRPDALADERRLVALVRARAGVICVSDLIALFGWTPAEADLELARVLGDYGGDVHVTADGALVYVFDALLLSTAAAGAAPDPAARTAPITRPGTVPPRFFGVDGWLVLAATALAALGVILHPQLQLFPDLAHYRWLYHAHPKEPWVIAQGFGLTPWLLVLAVPALRLPFHIARHLRARAERRLLPLLEIAARHPDGAPLSRVSVPRLTRLGGTLREDGCVAFPDLAGAVAAAAALRATRDATRAPGPVVFSSDPNDALVPG